MKKMQFFLARRLANVYDYSSYSRIYMFVD